MYSIIKYRDHLFKKEEWLPVSPQLDFPVPEFSLSSIGHITVEKSLTYHTRIYLNFYFKSLTNKLAMCAKTTYDVEKLTETLIFLYLRYFE